MAGVEATGRAHPAKPVQKHTDRKDDDEKTPAPNTTYFHFAECRECKHSTPVTEENLFQLMVKEPDIPHSLGKRCQRCGRDEWLITRAG
jgi:hypothetical protein